MKKHNRLILINLGVFLALVMAIEVVGQAIYRMKEGRFVYQNAHGYYQQSLFEKHPYLVGRLKRQVAIENEGVTVTTTARHTRWTGAADDDRDAIRIAVLGGSTTFGTKVTDRDTWPALLQARLGNRFNVVNYGVPGYSTAEAIIQLALIVPEQRPHFVVLYEGWNDLRNYHDPELGADYYGHGMRQFGNLALQAAAERSLIDRLDDRFAIAKLASEIGEKLASPLPPDSLHDAPDPFVNRLYGRNLRTLKLLAEQVSDYTLFVPQVLNEAAYTDSHESHPWSPRIRNSAMPGLLKEVNAIMMATVDDDAPEAFFVGAVLDESWTPADFVDSGHFSRQGGEKMATILSQAILDKSTEAGLLTPPQP